VYGAQAAAEHWYRKDAKDLTPIQAVKHLRFNQSQKVLIATSSSSYINNRKTKNASDAVKNHRPRASQKTYIISSFMATRYCSRTK
jgi:hypothetical protein